jgi:hypothetical protein
VVAAYLAAAQNVSIVKEGGVYKVYRWDGGATEPTSGWSSVFAVYAGEGDVPPMLGSYTVDRGTLVFRPKYPPSPGIRVRAVFRARGSSPVEARFNESKVELQPSAYIEHVYPSANILPDNLLKFYIQFSAPMSRGEAWSRIHLIDEKGSRVELPFLETVQELWDGENRRLTVLFDPGRIKRGLARRQQMGPALVEGRQYSLVVDREFQDARGVPMRAEFRKQFRVAPSDRVPPDTAQWRLTAPQAHTTSALVVEFTKPMDWAMLQRVFAVQGNDGRVAGTATVGREETEWRFVPTTLWKPGAYQLVVDTSLEDLAGNRIGRAFDVDLDQFDSITEHIELKTSSLAFRVDDRQDISPTPVRNR